MQTNDIQKSLQKRQSGTSGLGAAQAHDHPSAEAGQSQQQIRPNKNWYDRVQFYLEREPACQKWIGPCDQPIQSRDGETIFYSQATLDIVAALSMEGKELLKDEVLKLVNKLKPSGQQTPNPAPGASTLAAPLPVEGVATRPVNTGADQEESAPTITDNAGVQVASPASTRSKLNQKNAQAKPMQNNGLTVHDQMVPSPEPSPASEVALVPDESPDYWVSRINNHVTHGVKALIEAGRDLLAAKSELDHGDFHSMFAPGRLRISQRTAELFMQVASHPALSKPKNYSLLPPTLNALTKLSHLPETTLQAAIDKGKVTPSMTISDARALVAQLDDDGEKQPAPEVDATLCGRRLKVIGRFIEEAKAWPAEHRSRLVKELRDLLDVMES
jgi:hypothetical protein